MVHAAWMVGEQRSAATDEANFTFNICGNVNHVPSSCADQPQNSMAYMEVWQDGSKTTPACYSVGSNYNNLTPVPYSFALHDSSEPARGMNLNYLSGTPGAPGAVDCDDPKKTRSLSLAFLCEDQPFLKPGVQSEGFVRFADPSDTCSYEVFIATTFGCPQECPIVNGKLCSGQGVCRFDTGLQAARCFCDDGFIERDCSQPANPLDGGAVAGAIFGGIFIGLFGVGLYWGWQYYQTRGGGGGMAASAGDDEGGYYADAPVN
jgi:hypothetical protein